MGIAGTASLGPWSAGRNCHAAWCGRGVRSSFRLRAPWHSACALSGVARPSTAYQPRVPSDGVVYQVVRDHFETFRAEAARLREGDGLPRFVEEEFRAFLRCGWLAGGFARLRCGDCGLKRLVPFSCKGRAVCGSCAGRRMAERAAHLVDHVFPDAPVRQWVLTLPYRLRYLLAWDHDLCRAVALRRCSGPSRARSRDGGRRRPHDSRLSAARGSRCGSGRQSRRGGGPSTLREPQGRREPRRTATWLRAIPSKVEGWRSFSASAER